MRKHIAIIGSLALLLTVGTFAVAGASGTAIGEPRTFTVVRKISQFESQVADPDATNLGDRFEFSSELIDNGDVGHQWATCLVVGVVGDDQTNLCHGTYELRGGTIAAQTLTGKPSAVTGGTGIFKKVRGEIFTEILSGTRARVTFALLP
jgi:hypothetical protein